MKFLGLFLVVMVAIVLMAAIAFPKFVTSLSLAEVNKVDGLFVFVDCTPVSEYEVLGMEKSSLGIVSEQYAFIRDKLIRKVKKSYPTANGVLLHFNSIGVDRAEAIVLK